MNAVFMNNENVLYVDDTAIACVFDDLIALERSVNSILARLVPIQQNVFEPFYM